MYIYKTSSGNPCSSPSNLLPPPPPPPAQSARIDDQRCSPPEAGPHAPTVPDEDFFSLIQRVQAKRMDEQRVHLHGDDEDSPEPSGAESS